MGTDIHLFVEARRPGQPWELQIVKSECSWCGGNGLARDGKPCWGCKGTGLESGYNCRNYNVFSILADVRNGRGFAGIKTGDGFNPIAEPRGLPEDMSASLLALHTAEDSDDDPDFDERYEFRRATYGSYSLGDHSFSHLTLREMLEYNWNQRTNHQGVVGPREFATYLEKGAPASWSGAVSGRSVRHVSNKVMQAFCERSTFSQESASTFDQNPVETDWTPELESMLDMAGVPVPHLKHPANKLTLLGSDPSPVIMVTKVQWSESYKESARYFYQKFLPALAQFAQNNGYEKNDVRIVFGFDS
jgi:hypothetical protein